MYGTTRQKKIMETNDGENGKKNNQTNKIDTLKHMQKPRKKREEFYIIVSVL